MKQDYITILNYGTSILFTMATVSNLYHQNWAAVIPGIVASIGCWLIAIEKLKCVE